MKKAIILNVLTAIIVPIIIFLIIEIILYLAGVDTIYENQDPYLGFEEIAPLFKKQDQILSDNQLKFITQKNKLLWFNYQEFRVDKPNNGLGIFCFGDLPLWEVLIA